MYIKYKVDNRDLNTTELHLDADVPMMDLTAEVDPWELVRNAIENVSLDPEVEEKILGELQAVYNHVVAAQPNS